MIGWYSTVKKVNRRFVVLQNIFSNLCESTFTCQYIIYILWFLEGKIDICIGHNFQEWDNFSDTQALFFAQFVRSNSVYF